MLMVPVMAAENYKRLPNVQPGLFLKQPKYPSLMVQPAVPSTRCATEMPTLTIDASRDFAMKKMPVGKQHKMPTLPAKTCAPEQILLNSPAPSNR